MQGPGEPLWLEDDQDEILAYRRWRAEVCGGCGTHPDDWRDDPDAWVPALSRCPGCERRRAVEREIPEGRAGDGVHIDMITRAEHDRRDAEREQLRLVAAERAQRREREQAERLARRKAR